MSKKIVITGGTGRFASIFKTIKTKHKIFFPSKKELDILNENKIQSYLKKVKPQILIHLAGLSRPMSIHDRDIQKSINLNIIGTANITKVCHDRKIKLIYFSTHYVYPGTRGNYKETDSLLPVNNYAWSKLGGEASVQLYKNSLIVRVCMTEKPFIHKEAFTNIKTSFVYHDEVAKILFKLINKKGIINVGGQKQSVYKFAQKSNKKIKSISAKKKLGKNYPLKQSMNVGKYFKLIKK